MPHYMRLRPNSDGFDLIITPGEIQEFSAIIASGQALSFANLPFDGKPNLFIFGTAPDEHNEGNLRSFILPKDERTIDTKQIKGFIETLGQALGYKGTMDVGEYRNLTDEQIKDAVSGRGEFPFRVGTNPEREL